MFYKSFFFSCCYFAVLLCLSNTLHLEIVILFQVRVSDRISFPVFIEYETSAVNSQYLFLGTSHFFEKCVEGRHLDFLFFFFKCLMKCCKYFCSRRAFYFGNINLECHKKLWKVYFIPTLNLAHRSWLSRE